MTEFMRQRAVVEKYAGICHELFEAAFLESEFREEILAIRQRAGERLDEEKARLIEIGQCNKVSK